LSFEQNYVFTKKLALAIEGKEIFLLSFLGLFKANGRKMTNLLNVVGELKLQGKGCWLTPKVL